MAPMPLECHPRFWMKGPWGSPWRSSGSSWWPAALPDESWFKALQLSYMLCGIVLRCWTCRGASMNCTANPTSRCHSIWPVYETETVKLINEINIVISNLQCNIQTPGLSATKRRVTDCPAGIWIVSLRIGFACPSTTGRSSAGSEKFNDRPTIIGLCPCKWLFLEKKKKKKKRKKEKESIVITTKKSERKENIGLQRMFARIRVLNNNIDDCKMFKDETRRSISLLNRRIRTQTELWKDSRN